MTIKIGVVEQNRIDSEEYNIVTKSRATVIEKTQGSYTEYLICRHRHSQLEGDNYISDVVENCYSTYYGKTLSELLVMLDITSYTWTTPLTEVV